jgi:hypothetical protein
MRCGLVTGVSWESASDENDVGGEIQAASPTSLMKTWATPEKYPDISSAGPFFLLFP